MTINEKFIGQICILAKSACQPDFVTLCRSYFMSKENAVVLALSSVSTTTFGVVDNIRLSEVLRDINSSEGLIYYVGQSGSLTIDDRGNLVNHWSTNTSKQAAKPLVQLLDNGNLVLRDEEDANTTNYLWESFHYPTDSLLTGMKLGWDLFTYEIEFDE
ncbi:hypothetical protein G4B88_027742 [Cannabis sativa]|uniref:Bulb-type lectin domain-containing protein n=1 Tax=Cannabis sativa TaxID=3483 RepID=A0A7J6EIV7_CANSA|nr:hypothetical protein G4B88_027742 [Cannabis sativa]